MGPLFLAWWQLAAYAAASAYQSYQQNRSSRRNQATGMAWEEKMRETQYQTAVKDMKAAGINPMVAYQQGGAGNLSAPQASGGAKPEVAEAALTALRVKTELEVMNSQEEVNTATKTKLHADEALTKAKTAQQVAETKKFKKTGGGIPANIIDTGEKVLKRVFRPFTPGQKAAIKKRRGESLRAFQYRREVGKMPKKWQKKHKSHKHAHDIQRGKERR